MTATVIQCQQHVLYVKVFSFEIMMFLRGLCKKNKNKNIVTEIRS